MHFPDIVINKIYWYLWQYKQQQICQKYRNTVEWYDGDGLLVHNDTIGKASMWFNYRFSKYSMKIYSINYTGPFKYCDLPDLPKNYHYSIGYPIKYF
jgi:hypothetical protein